VPTGSTFRPAVRLVAGGARHEDGQAILIFELLLIPLLLMLALTVDLGIAYAERRQAQNVADSGARAGTAIVKKHIMAGNSSGMDAEVIGAIRDIAGNASGGFAGFTLGSCAGAVSGPTIEGEYVNYDGNAVGTVGAGDNGSAQGVRLTPCNNVSTNFARVVNLNSIKVSAAAASVFGVITAIDSSNPGYGPFAIWYGDTVAHPNCTGGVGCNKKGSTVIYRMNGWCGSDQVSSAEARAVGTMSCGANFKGDINHGQGFVGMGDITTKGGNALGQYKSTLEAHYTSGDPMLFPLISNASGHGSSVDLTVYGFACVRLTNSPGGGSSPYEAQILAISDADFSSDTHGCKALLEGSQVGTGPVTSTSITVAKMLQ
jgi:hypothetical protein